MKKELGKIFIDLGKILFATAFLGSIINKDLDKILVLTISGIFILICFTIGIIFIKKSNK